MAITHQPKFIAWSPGFLVGEYDLEADALAAADGVAGANPGMNAIFVFSATSVKSDPAEQPAPIPLEGQ